MVGLEDAALEDESLPEKRRLMRKTYLNMVKAADGKLVGDNPTSLGSTDTGSGTGSGQGMVT